MEDYSYYYYHYRGKYYDACSQINSCDQQIYQLQQTQTNLSKTITAQSAKIKGIERAIARLGDVVRYETSITAKVTAVSNKTQEAAVNYNGMVNASDVSNKDLSSVFSEELSTTKSKISSVFTTVKAKKAQLESELTELNATLRNKQQELEDIKRRIRTVSSNRSYWTRKKTSHYYNMEYYRKKMLAAE